jgi:two-component system sensor histidine kinase HydH
MRIPLKFQVGAVVALFVAALAVLWSTSASVVDRERRRVSAGVDLARAGDAMAERSKNLLASAPREFDELGRAEWDDLDSRLSMETTRALGPFDGV